MPPVPSAPKPSAPPSMRMGNGANAARINQANMMGNAQQAEHLQEESFGFSLIRRTAAQVLGPLTYGTIGASFFSLMLSAMAKLGESFTQIGHIGAQIAQFAPLNSSTIIQNGRHAATGWSASVGDVAVSITTKTAEATEAVAQFTPGAAGILLTTGLIFGAIGVTAALLSNAITMQMECEAKARAKCQQQAQTKEPAQAPQIVMVPVAVEVSQHAATHQRNALEANAESTANAENVRVKKKFNPGELAQAILQQRNDSTLEPRQLT